VSAQWGSGSVMAPASRMKNYKTPLVRARPVSALPKEVALLVSENVHSLDSDHRVLHPLAPAAEVHLRPWLGGAPGSVCPETDCDMMSFVRCAMESLCL
jgi:hypothetical protein